MNANKPCLKSSPLPPSVPAAELNPVPLAAPTLRSERNAGLLPSRRLALCCALAVAVLGFAVPSQAQRTTILDASPKIRESPPIRIGQQMTFKGRLVARIGNSLDPVPNARVSIFVDGRPIGFTTTRRDGSFSMTKTITTSLLRSPVPSQGRRVSWEAEIGGTKTGAIHGWGFWLMP
jgi:hypothetical protein